MNNRKAASIVISCLILVMLCMYIFESKLDTISISVNSYSVILQNESKEEESPDSDEIKKEDLFKSAKENLKEKLEIVTEYLQIKAPDKTTEDFVNWFARQYSINIVNELGLNSAADINRDFYIQTGKSLFVLCDEFLGNQDNNYRESKNAKNVNILFAGDICLEEDGFVLDNYDTTQGLRDCISENIIEKTNSADIFMLNNEFCFSDRGEVLPGKMYTFRANPARVSILQELGTDIASIANNHLYDFGADAFSDTLDTLKNAGISTVGGGSNSSEAEKVIYYIVNGMKIGFVSASRAEKVRYTPGAGEDSSGIFLMYDDTRLNEVIAAADKQCDYLIAYLHWGTEDSEYYETYQHDIAEKLINSGADAIIGGHPHILQGMEYINGNPVVYSLGDFWFNDETKYNGLVNLEIDINGLVKMQYIPCIQSDYKTLFIEDLEEQKKAMDYLRNLSPNASISDDGEIGQMSR